MRNLLMIVGLLAILTPCSAQTLSGPGGFIQVTPNGVVMQNYQGNRIEVPVYTGGYQGEPYQTPSNGYRDVYLHDDESGEEALFQVHPNGTGSINSSQGRISAPDRRGRRGVVESGGDGIYMYR